MTMGIHAINHHKAPDLPWRSYVAPVNHCPIPPILVAILGMATKYVPISLVCTQDLKVVGGILSILQFFLQAEQKCNNIVIPVVGC
jgi:hypothetical protein